METAFFSPQWGFSQLFCDSSLWGNHKCQSVFLLWNKKSKSWKNETKPFMPVMWDKNPTRRIHSCMLALGVLVAAEEGSVCLCVSLCVCWRSTLCLRASFVPLCGVSSCYSPIRHPSRLPKHGCTMLSSLGEAIRSVILALFAAEFANMIV